MRRRHDLQRRLARFEGNRGEGVCICANPVRVAWTRDDVVEHECPDCGGELIVVRLNFNEEPTPPVKAARTTTFRKIIAKAEPKIVDREGPKIDLEKLTDDELSDLRDAMTPPGEKRRPRRKATRPAKEPQQARTSATKRRTPSPSPAPRSAPRSDPGGYPVALETEHTAEPPTKRERAGEPSEKAWTSQRSRRRGSLTRGVIEQDF